MSRIIVQSILGFVIIAVGGMLLTSSGMLEYALIGTPYLPAGTILTWLFLMALPVLGWLLQHPGFLAGDANDLPEEVGEASSADDGKDSAHDPGDSGRDAGSDAADDRREGFLQRLGEALCVAALMMAFLWPFISALLAGNLSFSFGRERGTTEILFGIFIGYTALTFLLGVLSLIASLRPGNTNTSSRRRQ